MFLQRIASGDSSAVAQCLERYGNLVWSVARRWSANRDDAEDAVQEIFVDLWKSAGRYDPACGEESTFVMMIARRRLIDRRRKSGRQVLTAEGVVPETCDGRLGDPQLVAEQSEEAAIVNEMLSELRQEERELLELSVHRGLSHQEIAKQTGVPLGTVKSNIRRGLEKLRDRLRGCSLESVSRSVL
ncbi:RNA polymerase sigma factor [Planctomycetaceae bacterium SH139]